MKFDVSGQNPFGGERNGVIVLKPITGIDTRKDEIRSLRLSSIQRGELEFGLLNNQLIPGPFWKDGQITGAASIFDLGTWSSIDDLRKHLATQKLSWSSGSRSGLVAHGHCYAFGLQGRQPIFLKVLAVLSDGSVKLAWVDTDTRISLFQVKKLTGNDGSINSKKLQGTWVLDTLGQNMTVRYVGDSICFAGVLAKSIGSGPFRYIVNKDEVQIDWVTERGSRKLSFMVFTVGNKLFMFEGGKEYGPMLFYREN